MLLVTDESPSSFSKISSMPGVLALSFDTYIEFRALFFLSKVFFIFSWLNLTDWRLFALKLDFIAVGLFKKLPLFLLLPSFYLLDLLDLLDL